MGHNLRLLLATRVYRPPLRFAVDLLARYYRPRPIPARPKVLHVTPEHFADESHIGGGARYPLELARAMADYTPTRVVSFGSRRRTTRYGRARLEIYADRFGRSSGNPLGLGLLPALRQTDVVHCHQLHYRSSVVGILAGAVLRKPIFVSDLGGGATSLAAYLRLARFVCRFLDLSEFAARWLGTEGHSTIIYGGVDTERFSPPPGPSVRDHFLYVGRLLPHKGIDVLIRAAADDIPVTVAGRPYDERYYHDLQALAAGKPVRFITLADDAQLLELYRTAIAVVLPSVYVDMYGDQHGNPEYLGLTLLEGMACATPAICSAAGGMPEIVEDGVTGFVVPPGSSDALRACMLRLLDDPALATDMGSRACERVRSHYTWHNVAARCIEAYHKYSIAPSSPRARRPADVV